ncbi:MAG TPA: cadherin-like beta sandwich domain-containing protein, partial [Bacillales bacterium]|nr:cadherin-like beta sandwich domain-containing protein [Bacillales bacterium]
MGVGLKKGCFITIIMVFMFSVIVPFGTGGTAHAAGPFAGGSGTSSDPYIIVTPAQLDAVRDYYNDCFRLGTDIDLSGYANWEPISPFTGTFDGNGHVIRNITINHTDFYTGLFGTSSGTIKNVGIEDADVTGNRYTGGLVGKMDSGSVVVRSYVVGATITGGNYTGGLVGSMDGGSITLSYSSATVKGNKFVGGLVGNSNTLITPAGDILYAKVENSYATGSVEGISGYVGGLIGRIVGGQVTNSYASGDVTGENYLGGLVGSNAKAFDPSTSSDIGGTFNNSYASGTVTGSGLQVGNLYGDNAGGDMSTSAHKTDAEMKAEATFADWDFTDIWAIDEGVSTPYLRGILYIDSLSVYDATEEAPTSLPSALDFLQYGETNDMTVPYQVKQIGIHVDPRGGSSTVEIQYNGTTYKSDDAIPIAVGENTIPITIQDGSSDTSYTLTVTRQSPSTNADLSNLTLSEGTLSPDFDSGTVAYTTSVGNDVDAITITPTVDDPNATDTVNGQDPSQSVILEVGDNEIPVVVTAEDGESTKTYTITVNRAPSSNATLSGLTLNGASLDQTFDSGTTNYTSSVGNDVTSITVTPIVSDETATVTVNGESVTSGVATAPIDLNVGDNTVKVVVTAEDGGTQGIYTVTVNRAPSSNAKLTGLTLNGA